MPSRTHSIGILTAGGDCPGLNAAIRGVAKAAMHYGIHVIGGLVAFLLVIGRTFAARKFTHEQAVSAIVVSYYWHFVDIVWVALFASIYLIQ